jgi:hypothetical protein
MRDNLLYACIYIVSFYLRSWLILPFGQYHQFFKKPFGIITACHAKKYLVNAIICFLLKFKSSLEQSNHIKWRLCTGLMFVFCFCQMEKFPRSLRSLSRPVLDLDRLQAKPEKSIRIISRDQRYQTHQL